MTGHLFFFSFVSLNVGKLLVFLIRCSWPKSFFFLLDINIFSLFFLIDFVLNVQHLCVCFFFFLIIAGASFCSMCTFFFFFDAPAPRCLRYATKDTCTSPPPPKKKKKPIGNDEDK